MTTLTLELTDEQAAQWAQEAQRLNLTPEQLVTRSVEERLSAKEATGSAEFEEAMDYVFRKNSELHARLAGREERVSQTIKRIINRNEELYRRLA